MRLQLFSNYCLSPITNNIILLDLSCPLQMVYYIIYLNIFYIRTVWNSKQGIYRVILRNCQEVKDNCSTQGIEHVTKYFIKQAIVSNFKTISSGGAQIQVGGTQRGGLTSQGYCALFFDMIFLPAIQGILCSTCDRTQCQEKIFFPRKKYRNKSSGHPRNSSTQFFFLQKKYLFCNRNHIPCTSCDRICSS